MSDLIPPILPGSLTAAQIDLMVRQGVQHRDVRYMNGDLTDQGYAAADAGEEPDTPAETNIAKIGT